MEKNKKLIIGKYNLGSDLYHYIQEKVKSFFIEKFPDFNFIRVITEEEHERDILKMQESSLNSDGTLTIIDNGLIYLSRMLLHYEEFKDPEVKKEILSNGVAESKKICAGITKKAKNLRKEIDLIGGNPYLNDLFYSSKFSNPLELINERNGYSIKNPLEKKSDGFYSLDFRKTLKSYSEIKKSPETIMLLSSFILNDLLICMEKLEKKHNPKRGNPGKEAMFLNNIVLGLAFVFYKCNGEKPTIKRSGSSLSEKHFFNKLVLDFESEFNIQFNYQSAQEQIEQTDFFDKDSFSNEELLEYYERCAEEYDSDSEI